MYNNFGTKLSAKFYYENKDSEMFFEESTEFSHI